MAKQSPDRRALLEMLAKAAVASRFTGFSRWGFAYAAPQPRVPQYQPRYFTAAEYRMLWVLTELILPADESLGAQAAGVSEFIDFLAAHGEAELQPMRPGLARLQARAANGDFLALAPEQQHALLRSVTADPFFRLLRRYTVMGYYTSRIGLEELDFPGLQLYHRSPACPHTNDPEHRHLPAPRY